VPSELIKEVEIHEQIWERLTLFPMGQPFHDLSPHVPHTKNGHNYFGLVANFTYFPMIAQIHDSRLICNLIEDY
jgi:hypothetical protein